MNYIYEHNLCHPWWNIFFFSMKITDNKLGAPVAENNNGMF